MTKGPTKDGGYQGVNFTFDSDSNALWEGVFYGGCAELQLGCSPSPSTALTPPSPKVTADLAAAGNGCGHMWWWHNDTTGPSNWTGNPSVAPPAWTKDIVRTKFSLARTPSPHPFSCHILHFKSGQKTLKRKGLAPPLYLKSLTQLPLLLLLPSLPPLSAVVRLDAGPL